MQVAVRFRKHLQAHVSQSKLLSALDAETLISTRTPNAPLPPLSFPPPLPQPPPLYQTLESPLPHYNIKYWTIKARRQKDDVVIISYDMTLRPLHVIYGFLRFCCTKSYMTFWGPFQCRTTFVRCCMTWFGAGLWKERVSVCWGKPIDFICVLKTWP